MSATLQIRKRDRFRSLFVGSTGSSSHSNDDQASLQCGVALVPQPTTALPTSALVQNFDPSGDFLKDAFEALTTDERSVLEQYTTSSIDDTINAAYGAAKDRKAECDSKKWLGSDKAEKVVLWLDKFKSIGDVAAGLDPIHAGLPWAAVKLLLGVAVADSKRMVVLMGGMDMVLCTSGQLRAYFAYYQRLPSDPASVQFRKSLLDLFIHNLRFLAKAIGIYSKDPLARKWGAFWDESDLTTFGDRNTQLVAQADIAANSCDRELQEVRWAEAKKHWKKELSDRLEEINKIKDVQDSLSALHIKVDLSKLAPAQEALYNSFVEEKLGVCLNETRTDLLQRITAWADAPDGKQIFWLSGKAGTGKSTISRTIAQIFDHRGRLGASFFFNRNFDGRSNASRFFGTIVAQLADRVPPMRQEVAEALDKDSMLPKKGMETQFQKLFEGPLRAITMSNLVGYRLIIVIDALDECDSTDAETLLDLLASLKNSIALHLRVFITCRPETPMEVKLRQISDKLQEDIILEQVQVSTIRDDIRKYLEYRLAKIRRDWSARKPRQPLPPDWPAQSEIERIVDMSIPLFIFAATVCGFLNERNPRLQLQRVLDGQLLVASMPIHGEQTGLRLFYSQILEHAAAHTPTCRDGKDMTRFREVVCSLALLRNPLSVPALARLLDLENSDVEDVLDNLSAVLDNPGDSDKPVQFLHLSFREFLVDQMNDGNAILGMGVEEAHSVLWHKCIDLLSKPGVMHYDLFNLGRRMVKRDWHAKNDLATLLPQEVAYSCTSWTHHLENSKDGVLDDGKVHKFLQKHFLHWVEATSVLYSFTKGQILSCVVNIAKRCGSHELIAFADEVNILESIIPGAIEWPLHIYQRAMIAATKLCRLQSICDQKAPKIFTPITYTSPQQNAGNFCFKKRNSPINSITFSPDGSMVAIADWDGTVRLSDTRNGTTMKDLEYPNAKSEYCPPAAFSPDGSILAVTYNTEEVWLWDVQAGEVMHRLSGHWISIRHTHFSNDGQFLVTTDTKKTIRIWNVRTGAQEGKGFSVSTRGVIESMALSWDGQVAAFGLRSGNDNTIILYDLSPWQQIRTLTGFVGIVDTLVFSPNGRILASWNHHTDTLYLWDFKTGELIQQIEGVPAADRFCFSADGQFLYRGNTTYTIGPDNKIQRTERDMARLGIERGWVCYGGEELLCVGLTVWSEYKMAAIRDRTLVYEIFQGEVVFLRLVDDF